MGAGIAVAELSDILDAMAVQIRAQLASVTDVDVQIEPRMVLNPTPPTVDMYPGDPATDMELAAFGDSLGAEFVTLRARISTADHEEGQNLLLAFMDANSDLSLAAALDYDPTLNGTCASLDITNRTGYALYPVPNGDGVLLGFQFTLHIVKAES